MASVKQMGNKFFVYYYHPVLKTASGKAKQVYEDFATEEEANARKAEIEFKVKTGSFNVPSLMTVEDYFNTKYVPLYAATKWKHKTWDTNMSYWKNDILTFFGKQRLSKVSPSDVEKFMLRMKQTKVRNMPKTPDDEKPYISDTTVRYVYTLVKCFFDKAVAWEDIPKSPVKCAKPAVATVPRKYWEPEQFDKAFAAIDDDLLCLAIHLAFRCTLRIGELCAIVWDDINYETGLVRINKQMQRVTLESLKALNSSKVVLREYPIQGKKSGSKLIDTTPKSDYGTRTNTMSELLIEQLKHRERKVTLNKAAHGKKYHDFNLVFCLDDGRPIEPGRMSRRFSSWQKKNGLDAMGHFDSIDFHSIRISSTSLKLAVSGGDVKSVQKDLGDKTTHMVLSTYARSLKTQHQAMNDNFDKAFYGNEGGSEIEARVAAEKENNEILMRMVAEQLKQPQFLATVLDALQGLSVD